MAISSFSFVILLIVLALFLGIVGAIDLGYRCGKQRAARNPDVGSEKTDAVQTTVFSLLSLILAFVFSGAASRFDHRQDLVIQEATAIHSSYSLVDLLPQASQDDIRVLYKNYVKSRIDLFDSYQDEGGKSAEFVASEELQSQVWNKTSAAALATGNTSVISLVHIGLNAMTDSTAIRLHASRVHPPKIFYALLFGLILLAAFLVGYAMSAGPQRPWLHIYTFAMVMASTMYVILDFEYPRFGIVRIEAADQSLVDVLESMK
jgi:hypothetical protein